MWRLACITVIYNALIVDCEVHLAKELVIAWKGLSWTNVMFYGAKRDRSFDIMTEASKASISSSPTESTNITSEAAHLTLIGAEPDQLAALASLLSNRQIPPYTIMIVVNEEDEENWHNFISYLERVQISRGFYRLHLSSEGASLYRVLTVLHDETIVENKMEVEPKAGVYMEEYDMQGKTNACRVDFQLIFRHFDYLADQKFHAFLRP